MQMQREMSLLGHRCQVAIDTIDDDQLATRSHLLTHAMRELTRRNLRRVHLGDDDLTNRELEVLRLIRDGNRNKQIADQLAISETTVNFHIRNLVVKLQANDRTHAVIIAVRRGLLEI